MLLVLCCSLDGPKVGPGLLQAISNTRPGLTRPSAEREAQPQFPDGGGLPHRQGSESPQDDTATPLEGDLKQDERTVAPDDDLLERAREENNRHVQEYQRPISAETLRKRLRIGAGRSRMLVAIVRSQEPSPWDVNGSGMGRG